MYVLCMRQLKDKQDCGSQGLSRFVIVVVLRPSLQDEPELQPDEEGLVARALGGPVLGAGGAQEEQGQTLQVCLSSSPNTLSTYVFICPCVSVTVNRCAWCT